MDNDKNVARLEQRIETLSRQCRRQTSGLIATVIILAGVGLIAARNPTEAILRAERFEVVDEQGRVQGVFTSKWKWGAPGLALFDQAGDPFAYVTMVDVTVPGEIKKTTSAVLQLAASDSSQEQFTVTSMTAMPRAGGFTVGRNDDDSELSVGISDRGMGMSLGKQDRAALVDISLADDKPLLQLRDGDGNSLFRAP